MRRWFWCVQAGMVAGCGLIALMSWSVAATVGWWFAGGLVAVALRVCAWPDQQPIRWREMLVKSLPWPTVLLAVGGLVVALDMVTALLVTAAGLAAAWQAEWLGGPTRGDRTPGKASRIGRRSRADGVSTVRISPRVVDLDEAELVVTDALTDSDLCMAWRSSYVALDRASDPDEKLRAVQIRELLLDELGRRDASGLEAWFRSGARAAGWPDRYLRDVPPRRVDPDGS
jgi:hypothetical protein